jgi:alpha-tubulin suppressor-like RCC1 family protein
LCGFLGTRNVSWWRASGKEGVQCQATPEMTDQDTGDILTGKRIRLVPWPGKAHRRWRHPAARWAAGAAVLILAVSSYAADQAISLAPASAAETYPTTIGAGYNHSCMIVTGQAYCWGDNTYGELGDDSTVSSTVPVPVDTGGVLSGVTLTQITAGHGYTCALASTGDAYCWGYNADGELGDSSAANSSVPVRVTTSGVLAGVTLTQISAGEYATCGVSGAGSAYCWGQGTSGQLGDGLSASSPAPVAVSTGGALAGTTLTQVSAGGLGACALTSAGAAYCWGLGSSGQLGNGGISSSSQPVAVSARGVRFGEISVGYNSACALTTAGTAYCWGYGSDGELGDGGTSSSGVPVPVSTTGVLSGLTLTQISTGYDHSCALSAAGAAYCWGSNNDGQLGSGSAAGSGVPVAVRTSGVMSGRPLTQIIAGQYHTCAVGSPGTRYCWGLNSSGQAGNRATSVSFRVPVAVTPAASSIASGSGHSCLLRDGQAYCWGDDSDGELGTNTTTSGPQTTPVPVYAGGALSGVTLTQISAGRDTSCALSTAGAAYCWGAGSHGQLGNGSTTGSDVPVAVTTAGTPLAGITLAQISVGADAVCALSTAGAAYCWGAGSHGQLGNGSTTGSDVPVAVTTAGTPLAGTTLAQLSAGSGYTCALGSTGAAYCWGLNSNGQLGTGTTTSSDVPEAVTTAGTPLAGTTLTQLSAGRGYPGTLAATCAVSSAGAVYCWGAGGRGQLGNGTNRSTQDTPVAVTARGALAGTTVTQVTAGSGFTCALSSVGAAYCWGTGGLGQLGDSATRSGNVPEAVTTSRVLAGVRLIQISSGQLATCAQDSTGAFYCWGGNRSGQLGNGGTTSSDAPVAVAGIVPWAPASVIASPGNTIARVSWTASASLGIGTLTGYAVTTSPGGARCSTASAVSCTLTGLANGTTYRVRVVTRTTDGDSAASRPVTVTPWPRDTGISAGRASGCTLDRGRAYCWGDDTDGELGNDVSTSAPQTTPVAVYTGGVLSGVRLTQIAAGARFACALSAAGAVYCWGAGGRGQLGDGARTTSDVPVAVTTTAGNPLGKQRVTQISAGGSFACALSATGAVYCWGAGGSGQLGNGSTTPAQNVPVAVTAAAGTPLHHVTVTQISAGGSFACALSATGAVYCWGAGGSGQLGNGSTTPAQSVPVAVTAAAGTPLDQQTVTQIDGGAAFTCALDTAGTAYCWGSGGSGQLGNGSIIPQHTAGPVGPTAPTEVTGAPGNTTITVSWAAPAFLNNGTLTGYTARASPGTARCATTRTTGCTLTGLKDGTPYTITVISRASTGTSAPSSPAIAQPTGLSLISPTSLAWNITGNGADQSVVDPAPADQRLTVDSTATGADWHITVSATPFSGAGHALPGTGVISFTGSTTSLTSSAPSATCDGPCVLPANTMTYPVSISTAASAPPVYLVYDASAGTGEGQLTLGGSSTAHPIGWWVQVPASVYSGVYTTTLTLTAVSGP